MWNSVPRSWPPSTLPERRRPTRRPVGRAGWSGGFELSEERCSRGTRLIGHRDGDRPHRGALQADCPQGVRPFVGEARRDDGDTEVVTDEVEQRVDVVDLHRRAVVEAGRRERPAGEYLRT